MSRVAKSITSGGSLSPNLIITVVKKCGFHFCFESLSFFSPQSFFCLGEIKKPGLIFPPCESSYGIAPQLSCLSFPATHSPLLISFLWPFPAPNPIFPRCLMGASELDGLGVSLLDSKVFPSPVNSLILWDSVSVLLPYFWPLLPFHLVWMVGSSVPAETSEICTARGVLCSKSSPNSLLVHPLPVPELSPLVPCRRWSRSSLSVPAQGLWALHSSLCSWKLLLSPFFPPLCHYIHLFYE